MSNKWIRVDKSAADGPRVFQVVSPIDTWPGRLEAIEGRVWQTQALIPFVLWQVDSIEDEVQRRLQLVQAGQAEKLTEKERNELRKRKLLTEV